MDKFELAEWLHDNYEELAKANDWQTQQITRVKFNDLPQANKDTMLALADRLHNTFLIIARQADVSGSLQPLTVQRVDKMLKDISLETFIACGGNKSEWKDWWSKRNAVNVNSNDR